MTRKQFKQQKEEPLQLAEFHGGGVEDEMLTYIGDAMTKLWKTYASRRGQAF